MLPSYEAIYDHGQLTWISEAPASVRMRVIVTPIPERSVGERSVVHPPPAMANALPRKHIGEEEIEYVMQNVRGAWGEKSLHEVDALIRQRRSEDWGEDDRVQ